MAVVKKSSAETDELQALMELLETVGQTHLIRFWDRLTENQRAKLAKQIREIDWTTFRKLSSTAGSAQHWHHLASRAEPPTAITLSDLDDADSRLSAQAAGLEALSTGKVAFVLAAGGQGSRLGFDHPKGVFPVGPVSKRTLFQILIEHALARGRRSGVTIPIYIMTSPQTDEEIRQFLAANHFFGYPPSDIQTFCQGVVPAIDATTKRVLLSQIDELFVNPDGHGGCLAALRKHHKLDDMRNRGIEYVFYGQVDNPLLQICDPVLIGYHIRHASEMTTQVVRKRDPLQKVGNVVRIDGKTQIIEYSDLPESVARQTIAGGGLKLWAGSIAVHVFDRAFLDSCSERAETLPFHLALKRVDHVDEAGNRKHPAAPNAIKFERFIFDLLPHARHAIVCEVDPAMGFAALKNAEPAPTETLAWVQAAMVRLHTRWLEQAGAVVAPGTPIEISPYFALDADEVAQKISPGQRFTQPTFLTS